MVKKVRHPEHLHHTAIKFLTWVAGKGTEFKLHVGKNNADGSRKFRPVAANHFLSTLSGPDWQPIKFDWYVNGKQKNPRQIYTVDFRDAPNFLGYRRYVFTVDDIPENMKKIRKSEGV